MPNASHAVEAAVGNLAAYLRAQVTGLTVLDEWPTANQKLAYPTVTLFSGKITTMNRAPELIAQTDPDVDNKVTATEVIGEHDFKLQLDLWCSSKPQRNTVIKQITDAINAKSLDSTGDNNPAGLSLQCANYFNDWIRYDIDGQQYVDDEAAAQRQERRVRIDLLVNCRAIQERTYYAMVNIETYVGAIPLDSQMADDQTFVDEFVVAP